MALNLKKGESTSISGDGKFKVGLGWDTYCDLDTHAYIYSKGKALPDCVYFGETFHWSGAVHLLGDNTTGEGSGDDEIIEIDYKKLPKEVTKIVFKVHVYTFGKTFANVKGAFIRIVDENGKEICRYNIDKMGIKRLGRWITFGKLIRQNDTWIFKCI